MKNIIFYTLAFTLNILYSQNNKVSVEYNFTNFSMNRETKGLLVCNNNKSIYKTFLKKYSLEEATIKDDNNLILAGKLINPIQVVEKDTLYSYEILDKTIYKVKEMKPKFNWVLDSTNSKMINKYLCQKATTTFRGRNYEAWYSSELAINSGPWKFNGLPGLILELKDENGFFIWKATKIVYPSKNDIAIPYKKIKETDLKEFVEIKNNRLERLRSRIKSILPRRNTMAEKQSYERRGIEKIYEWEEEKKKQ